jgi:hypothetical protein
MLYVFWYWTPPIDVAQQAIEQLQQYFKDNETSDAYVALVDVDGNAKARGFLLGFAFLLIVDLNGLDPTIPRVPSQTAWERFIRFHRGLGEQEGCACELCSIVSQRKGRRCPCLGVKGHRNTRWKSMI